LTIDYLKENQLHWGRLKSHIKNFTSGCLPSLRGGVGRKNSEFEIAYSVERIAEETGIEIKADIKS